MEPHIRVWISHERVSHIPKTDASGRFWISQPYKTIRVIQRLAEDERHAYPRAADIIKSHLYVDDLLTGANTIDEARLIRDEVTELLSRGGFTIRQWASNDERIINDLESNALHASFKLNADLLKTLGITWSTQDDEICYTTNSIKSSDQVTKRNILSEIAKIYNPSGLLGPVILLAKRLMQNVWRCGITWDKPVPQTIYTECNVGYGACLYVRSKDNQGNATSRLLCSKSRVAPLKPVTIPRLELCGALLLAQLLRETASALELEINRDEDENNDGEDDDENDDNYEDIVEDNDEDDDENDDEDDDDNDKHDDEDNDNEDDDDENDDAEDDDDDNEDDDKNNEDDDDNDDEDENDEN
ncbi:PREDICTED: vacuolar protein sorting-associated protein 13-like protein [Wasmannia auropunctata]|uniref:vacuolar protein sorting-associated protein 13-like protein n=1 Tax=Wasmannia auropunctata TaxID=64793 RepID=UPI0005F03D32|nr:PREDICTED: vacuolar protein sorting-associated protein 13-like protein [Wasmannia auropunctata]